MNRLEWKWLGLCGALAVGIAVALALPRAAELWPVALGLSGLVALIGFGFAVRGWPLLAVALVGLALAHRSAVQDERLYRESPWMRNAVRRSPRVAPSPVKAEISRRIGLGVGNDPEVVALNRAILLGERRRLPPRLKRVFVESGAIHVFAISGLHVMVVAKILMFMLALCLVPLRWQGFFSVPLLWGYVILIGSPPSAVRAALMATFYFGAPVVWRRPNGPIAWSLAFLLIHLGTPGQLAEVGSLFSFAVMLMLVLAGRVVRLPRRPVERLLFLTAAAWAAGVPIAATAFGRLTPGGLLANLVLVSTAAYSVVAGAIAILVSFVCRPLAEHFNNLAVLVTNAMVGIASAVSRLPCASVEIPRWGAWECVGWYLAVGLSLFLVRHVQERRRNL